MKPCFTKRKKIAWLALDALDERKAAALREHLALCEGCRRYWEEISNVTQGLASAAPDSDLEVSASFYRRVAEKLQAVESGSVLENLVAWLRGSLLSWRVALPVTAVLVIAAFTLVALRQHPVVSESPRPMVPVASASEPTSDLAPTLANYQMIANQSLDKLDELLTRQGNKPLPPVPTYTVSGYGLANGSL